MGTPHDDAPVMAVVVFGFLYDFLDRVWYACEDGNEYSILQCAEPTKLKINDVVPLVEAFEQEVNAICPGFPVLWILPYPVDLI